MWVTKAAQNDRKTIGVVMVGYSRLPHTRAGQAAAIGAPAFLDDLSCGA